MWQPLFKSMSEHDVPIGHITNGIHTPTWLNKITFEFWKKETSDAETSPDSISSVKIRSRVIIVS